jgi:peptide deformylase
MAILKIARMGHPVLMRKADPVADPTAPDIALLARDMLDTLEDIGGRGLAAPQVHVPRRVVIFHSGEPNSPGPDVLINPVIEPIGEETALGWEGCLSVPGLRGVVPRWRRIRYAGLDLDGNKVEREAADMHARVVQHECDHLDGVLYPQRMPDLRYLIFETEAKHHLAQIALPEDVD